MSAPDPSPTLDPAEVWGAVAHWIAAWNRRDLEAILSHYAEDVRFSSPTVVTRYGEPSCTLRGKAALRAHFARGLNAFGDRVEFRLIDVLVGVRGYTVYYARETGSTVVDTVIVDASGAAQEVHAHYRAARPDAGAPP
jgi:ketosteroid isomerase-like protein